jgi:hypothetical protein
LINYQLLTPEQVKHLKISEDGLYGTAKYSGQTVDIRMLNGKIKRVTFGVTKLSFTNLVAITSEILHNYHEEDYIEKKLDQAAYENGY